MPEGMVAIDQMPDGAVQAEEDVMAIERVLEGQGREMSSETRDASMSE
jgi:hypothetical protein